MKVLNGEVIMSKDERRALNALRRAEKSPAWDRVSAYVIIHPDGKKYGKIKCAWPKDGMGPLHVFVWDCDGNGLQYDNARGCGYDKLGSAMCGIVWDGHKIPYECGWESFLIDLGYQVIQAV